MQWLNVGAGRTDAEYQAAEEARRRELLEDSRACANLFFWAAGAAVIGTGLVLVRITFVFALGWYEVLMFYGRNLGAALPVALLVSSCLWVAGLVGLSFAARAGMRWAFWVGIVIYGLDMILLLVTFSIWAFGLHAFFVFKWYEGQKKLGEA
jgi:hypothetical protein